MGTTSQEDKIKISAKMLKDAEYMRLKGLSVDQREELVNRKLSELSTAFKALGRESYKDQINNLINSKYFLIIERLLLDGFKGSAIASYVKENFTDDEFVANISESSLISYISKLRKGIEKNKVLLKMYQEDKEKGGSYEERLKAAIDEVEIISMMANLQKERVLEFRKKEKVEEDYNVNLKKEIELVMKLVESSAKMKETVGAFQNQNKDTIELFKERLAGSFQKILDGKSSERIRSLVGLIINPPHESNLITAKELEAVDPHKANEVMALKRVQKDINEGKYPIAEKFFDEPRKSSFVLTEGIREEDDVKLLKEDKDNVNDTNQEEKDIEDEIVSTSNVEENEDYIYDDLDDLEEFE